MHLSRLLKATFCAQRSQRPGDGKRSKGRKNEQLADAGLIRLAEMYDSPLQLTTDRDFHIYRRHGMQTIPLVSP
jgi:hypothetical protein